MDVVPTWTEALREQVQAEVHAMLRHALANGLDLPPGLVEAVVRPSVAEPEALFALHAQLGQLVAPARPGTLRLLQSSADRAGPLSVLGPLRNLRWLTVAAFGCVAAFVAIAMSPLIDGRTMTGNLFELHGWTQLMVMLFLLAAAGMGSTFQALFIAQRHVADASYDPLYDSSYWVRIGLGVVAGLMLAVLVPFEDHGQGQTVERPLLALLGGFSVRLVHRVLQRLVDAVTSVFGGDPAEAGDAPRGAPPVASRARPAPIRDAPDPPGSHSG